VTEEKRIAVMIQQLNDQKIQIGNLQLEICSLRKMIEDSKKDYQHIMTSFDVLDDEVDKLRKRDTCNRQAHETLFTRIVELERKFACKKTDYDCCNIPLRTYYDHMQELIEIHIKRGSSEDAAISSYAMSLISTDPKIKNHYTNGDIRLDQIIDTIKALRKRYE
jgi:predicted RNase H-like nuclease (RuvC/YqgF family)